MLPNNQSFSIALLLEAIFRKNKDVSSVNWLILCSTSKIVTPSILHSCLILDDWPEKYFSGQSARRSIWATLSLSYTQWFSSSITGRFSREFQKKAAMKPRKSQAVTWVVRNNTFRSIFTADVSKVYRIFLYLMYKSSTLLFLVTREASREHSVTYYFSSIVERLLKLSTMYKSPLQRVVVTMA